MTHYYTKVSNVSEVTKKFCHLLKAKKVNDHSYLTTYIAMLRTIYCSTHDPAYYSILIQTFIRTLLMMLIMVYDFGLFYFYLFLLLHNIRLFNIELFLLILILQTLLLTLCFIYACLISLLHS